MVDTDTASLGTAFRSGWFTHPGRLRSENEDAAFGNCHVGLWAVADGMGGHAGGRLASSTLVGELAKIEAPRSAGQLLADCEARIVDVNAQLVETAEARGVTIGTTVALLLAYGSHYACIWSGDSRVYLVRSSGIALLSHDHSQVQDLVDHGLMTEEEGRASPDRNIVTRAIGVKTETELEIRQGDLMPGDVFILCSDGLTIHVEDNEILGIVDATDPQPASERLVSLALDRGGKDNVTVVVVRHLDGPR